MKSRLRRIGTELLILATVIVCSLGARSALADHYYIPSESMEYSLLVGDRVVVDKTAYGLRVPFTDIKITEGPYPERGEIVVFDSPESGVRLIKRVVAVAGDVVQVEGGKLTINGQSMESKTAADLEIFGERQAQLNLRDGGGPDMEPTVIPDGKVMVMGDNRGNSRDSRAFGFIPKDAIYGHAFRLYYRRGEGFVWRPI
ncbi:MAG: signal peptidase I [Acidobacteriota bacterium]|jgi:signal peptidase I